MLNRSTTWAVVSSSRRSRRGRRRGRRPGALGPARVRGVAEPRARLDRMMDELNQDG